MNKIIYFISIVCFFIIFNLKNQLQLYYIQYNPKNINLEGYLVDKNNEFELYEKNTNDIVFYTKTNTLINNNHIKFIYSNSKKYSNIIYPIKYDYTNNLNVNNNKKHGSYLIITYKSTPTITYIDSFIDYLNIIDVTNNIIRYTKNTNNKILFLDYLITTDTKKLYVKNFKENDTECEASIFNLTSLISLIINNKNLFQSKKQLYIICGEISNLINNMKLTTVNKNLLEIQDNNIFYKKDDVDIKIPNKVYDIDGLDVTDKTIKEIKELIDTKPKVPVIKNNFIKNNQIGKGLFSNVYKNGENIIKILKKESMYSHEYDDEIKSSIKINNIKNSNKYFPRFYRSFICKINDEYHICLEYQYISGKTLSKLISDKKNVKNNIVKKIINNIIKGNEYLNKNGIKRIDNHLNNIIITNNYEIKYIDFGRTFIVNNPNMYQLDDVKYFKLLLNSSNYILQSNLSEQKSILNLIFSEFLSALSKLKSN